MWKECHNIKVRLEIAYCDIPRAVGPKDSINVSVPTPESPSEESL